MRRWHDRSPEEVLRDGGTLAPEHRFADRVAELLLTIEDLRDILGEQPSMASAALAGLDIAAMLSDVERVVTTLRARLPPPGRQPSRDPELAHVLQETRRRLRQRERAHGRDRDLALAAVERYAGPYALAFFYEIRRLDQMRGAAPQRTTRLLPACEKSRR